MGLTDASLLREVTLSFSYLCLQVLALGKGKERHSRGQAVETACAKDQRTARSELRLDRGRERGKEEGQ